MVGERPGHQKYVLQGYGRMTGRVIILPTTRLLSGSVRGRNFSLSYVRELKTKQQPQPKTTAVQNQSMRKGTNESVSPSSLSSGRRPV